MPRGYFRCLVQKQWEKDPWFTRSEAAAYLGLVTPEPISRYIKWGLLKAVRRPQGGSAGEWLVFKSELDRFKRSNARKRHRFEIASGNRKAKHLAEGKPIQVLLVWKMRCPKCNHLVRIYANPHYHGPEVKRLFTELIAGGACSHGRKVEMV